MWVLVPSTGNLYIYIITVDTETFVYLSSRPLHGESIYLLKTRNCKEVLKFVLVPSTGNLYIYEKYVDPSASKQSVLVPSTGNLYIYEKSREFSKVETYRSRPLHGESIYLRHLTKV